MLTMHRDGSLAAAAGCLPDFHSYISGIVGDERFVVGVSCPQHLVIAAESLPCVLRVDNRGLSIRAERR